MSWGRREAQDLTRTQTQNLLHNVRALPALYNRIAIDKNFEKKSARQNLALSFKKFTLLSKNLEVYNTSLRRLAIIARITVGRTSPLASDLLQSSFSSAVFEKTVEVLS